MRTVAEGKRVAELDAELKVLTKRWEDALVKVQKTQKRPQLIFEETGRAVALLRDLFNPTYENIYVNDENVFHEVKTMFHSSPQRKQTSLSCIQEQFPSSTIST